MAEELSATSTEAGNGQVGDAMIPTSDLPGSPLRSAGDVKVYDENPSAFLLSTNPSKVTESIPEGSPTKPTLDPSTGGENGKAVITLPGSISPTDAGGPPGKTEKERITTLSTENSKLKEAIDGLKKQLDKVKSEITTASNGTAVTVTSVNDKSQCAEVSPEECTTVECDKTAADGDRAATKDSAGSKSKDGGSKDEAPPPDHASAVAMGSSEGSMNSSEEEEFEEAQREAQRISSLAAFQGSALGFNKGLQGLFYLIAIGVVVFVLTAKATKLGVDDSGASGSSSGSGSASAGTGCAVASHRRLAPDVMISMLDMFGYEDSAEAVHRRLGTGPPPLLEMIAYCLTGVGIVTFFVNLLKQPLILGYLLGGVFVGPVCLDIVHGVCDIQDFSSLGLIFLLFMVGLELDVTQLLYTGKVVLVSGFLQFPLCAAVHLGAFVGLQAAGINFGDGDKSVLYMALGCSISSTMIVVKALSAQADMDSPPGRLTIGMLICQDIWAIVVLAIQPDMSDPKVEQYLKQFGMIALLIAVALAYAKFILPVVFVSSSKNVELMLVISLCWCFFMCCFAILPFIGLSMELAALISGVALATYPHSSEFNGKIKYIRDFFITIFFCGLGIQIPTPKPEPILTALLISVVVLLVRWLGIFVVVSLVGGNTRLAGVTTINLSEVSEFALVICSLGMSFGHIGEDTLTIMIWVFALLAVFSANLLPYNYHIYAILAKMAHACRPKKNAAAAIEDEEEVDDGHNIVILGFHKIAALLIQQLKLDAPEILHKLHVVDFNQSILKMLEAKGITSAYGDISSAEVLEKAVKGEVRLVLLTIPDTLLRGTSTLKLLKTAQEVWPECKVIANSDHPADTEKLYAAGADYVLEMSRECAGNLAHVLKDLTQAAASSLHTSDAILKKHSSNDIEEMATKKRAQASVIHFA